MRRGRADAPDAGLWHRPRPVIDVHERGRGCVRIIHELQNTLQRSGWVYHDKAHDQLFTLINTRSRYGGLVCHTFTTPCFLVRSHLAFLVLRDRDFLQVAVLGKVSLVSTTLTSSMV